MEDITFHIQERTTPPHHSATENSQTKPVRQLQPGASPRHQHSVTECVYGFHSVYGVSFFLQPEASWEESTLIF